MTSNTVNERGASALLFLRFFLRIPNICCTFAADFKEISEVVLRIFMKYQE